MQPDHELPHKGASPLDVLVIGAGFSGICMGIKLLQQGSRSFRIVEKSQGIGGTWWENSYPGAACDVPSHFYCYSFEPNPGWSRVYSPSAEIQQYLERCVDKYSLRPYLVNGAKVTRLELDENRGVWVVHFAGGSVVEAHHVVNGGGGLHRPSIPYIAGAERFAGATMHTARWDHSVDMAGQRVAVIGSAASAIQVIPEVAKIAQKVIVFQRTPNYIVPREDRAYSEREKRRFARWPWFLRLYRWFIFMRMELLLYPITRENSAYGKRVTRKILDFMRQSVRDRDLQDVLTPDYVLGCKRILLSDDLYAALNRDNVEVVTSGIDAIEVDGVRSRDGELHEADVIVYATGFDINAHMRSIDVVGAAGKSLAATWQAGPEAYNGSCVAGFPNYYLVTGPNTGVGTTSVVFMIEQSVNYILRLIDMAGNDKLISVKAEAQRRYNASIHAQLGHTVWASGCSSWYLQADGKNTTLYPGNARQFRRQLATVDTAAFQITDIPAALPDAA